MAAADQTPGAFQTTYAGHTDAFVSKLASSGSSLVYSTLLGGGTNDNRAFGIARDVSGNAYVVGFTRSKSFTTTSGEFQTTNGCGGSDAQSVSDHLCRSYGRLRQQARFLRLFPRVFHFARRRHQ